MKKFKISFELEDKENIPLTKVEIACIIMDKFNIHGYSQVKSLKVKVCKKIAEENP